MRRAFTLLIGVVACIVSACTTPPLTAPGGWSAPEVLVAPSSFTGVHGLAVDTQGRLLAGSVVGNAIWQVDRDTGAATVLVGGPEGQADNIAIGPKGEMAWTNDLIVMVRYRENDVAPMRVLAKDLPGLNSLDFDGRNGKLYASQVFLGDGLLSLKNRVVRIDPANGAITVIHTEFKTPAAANLDGKGNLWVIDTATGELSHVDLSSGRKTVFKQLKTAIDNLAIAPDGTLYVSNMADNAIDAVNPTTGAVRTLTSGKLAVPGGIKLSGNTLWVADIFAFRKVDVTTGAVTDVMRIQASDMAYPFAVGVGDKLITLTSWFTGSVQVLDRATMKTQHRLHGWKAPYDTIPLADGSLLVAELASGIGGPVQLVLGADGALHVTEAAGNLLRINLADGAKDGANDGAKTVVAAGLALPEGLAQTPWGTFIVAETAAAKLTETNLQTGTRRTVADKLPIGLSAGRGMPPPCVPTGVDVAADGTIYFSADRNNAVHRIRPAC